MSLADILRRELAGIIELSDAQLTALTRHYELLLLWNRNLNLTTVTELPQAAIRHYCESLYLASRLTPGSVVDIGSGAGFPGIPVGVAMPQCRVALVESHQRKAVFLREAVRDLPNVKVIAGRAEGISSGSGFQGKYDWLVSRAVDPGFLRKLQIAECYALLVGSEDVDPSRSMVTPLPWGERRFLITGLCSTWNT